MVEGKEHSSEDITVLTADAILLPRGMVFDQAIVLKGEKITAIEPVTSVDKPYPQANRINLAGQVIMPGFVNAHQHGSGLTSIQLGNPDEQLEIWLGRGRKRKSLSPFWITSLAAIQMAANGVTSTIQANTPYGTGNFTDEIRAFARAYESVGLRAMVGIGARDRAEIVYPSKYQDGFLAGLPQDLRDLIGDPRRSPYAGDAAATIDVMANVQREFKGSRLISFAYAPAAPHWVSDEMFKNLVDDAAARKVGVHTHALESYMQVAALAEIYPEGFLAHLEKIGVVSERLSLAHAVWLCDNDVRIAAEYGVTLVRNPGSNLRLRSGIAPLGRYLAAGVNVALGSDSMTLHEDEDLFSELRLAVNLARAPGWIGTNPPDVRRMTEMSTLAGARAMLLNDKIGSLEVGKSADLIGVSLERVRRTYLDPDIDFLTAIYARARGEDVRLTMVGGRIIYRDGEFSSVNREEIVRRAAEEGVMSRIEQAAIRDQAERLMDHLGAFYSARYAPLKHEPWIPVADKGIWS